MTSGTSHKRVQEDVQPHQALLIPIFQRNRLPLDTEPDTEPTLCLSSLIVSSQIFVAIKANLPLV